MKKTTLALLALISTVSFVKSQPVSYVTAPPFDNSTTQVRAPNGLSTQAYMRGCALVLASELTGITANSTLTSFGYTLNSGSNANVVGNFTLYLENTTDLTYNKGTNFTAAIVPMITAYASTMTIPNSTGATSITINLSTPFVYSGGGIYVAYDWFSLGPFGTLPATYRANSTGLIGGCATAAGTGPAPATLGTTSFRPNFLFGVANSYTNEMEFIGITAPGGVAGSFNLPHTIQAIIKNSSGVTSNNIPVSLNVGGANTFVDTQTITSLASGASTVINFAPFNPGLPGLNTISVTVPSDQNTLNDLGTYTQSVTCNVWAQNPAAVSYTQGSVGFNTGSGIIASTYSNPITSTLTGLRGSVSTNVASVGNNSWGVLLSSTGSILATTNTVAITNTLLGTIATYSFATPQNLTSGSTYYFGFAQPTGTLGYFPMGTYTASNFVPFANYVTTTTLGGIVTPLASSLGYFNIEAIFAPNMTLTAASQSVVCGSVADLTVNSSANYTWNTGPTNTSISVTPTVTTIYSVSASNTLGCLATKDVTVVVDPLPVVAASNSTLICVGETVTLSANGAPTYSWSAGSSPSSSTFTDVPLTTTTYSVEGSNSAGCTNTGVVTVQVVTFSTMILSNSSMTTCLGNSITISATGANSYTWNTGISTSSNSILQINPTVSAVYTLTGADAMGCEDTQIVSVTVDSFTPGITTPTSICNGQQIVLNATGGAPNTYTWSTGMGFTNITVTPTVTTGYSVVATGTNGCPGFAGTTITVNINPTVTAVSNRSLQCVNESNSLSAFGATSYSWSSGETTSSISITPAINVPVSYTVTGISAQGCTDSKVLTILVNACTNINEQAKRSAHIQLFPNPFKNLIELNYENVPENTTVKVLNALGQNVLTLENINDNTQINLENQANGLYFITIIQNKKATSQFKVVKQ